jgi:hypothetical protein
MRQAPGDLEATLLAQMHESLDHKYERLGEYRAQGAIGILVIESEDIALVSEQSLFKAFLRAMRDRPRPNLDQVWLASTFGDDCSVYCFSGPVELMQGVSPENLRSGPEFTREWLGSVPALGAGGRRFESGRPTILAGLTPRLG